MLGEDEVSGSGAEHYAFEDLTIDDIQTILGDKYRDGKAYIYEYDYQEGPEGGAQETKRAAVMLVSLDAYAGGDSRITYYTDITRANENGLNYSTSIENAVKAVWKWDEGKWPGVGEGTGDPFGSVTIKKEYEIDVKPVGKKGVHYDELTNLITWELEVNRPGVNLDELWIQDALELSESSWAGAVAAGEDLVLTGYDRTLTPSPAKQAEATAPNGKDLTVPCIQEAAGNPDAYADQNYYTVTELEGKQILTVHLYNVKAEDYYKFQIQTYVENRNYAVSSLVIKNTAEYWGTSGDQTINRQEVTAQQPITHTLIAKSAEAFTDSSTGETYLYDYENNTVQWKVRINEKGLPIDQAVITDELPLGVSFPYSRPDAVTGAVRSDRAGATSAYGIWKPGTEAGAAGTITFNDGSRIDVAVSEAEAAADNGKGYSKDTVTFTFVNADGSPAVIHHRYEITFITELDENFRREVVKSNEITKLLNRAKLDGSIDGRPVQTGWVTAENQAAPKPLWKEGSYHGRTGNGRYEKYLYQYYDENDMLQSQEVEAAYFNWTAYVNRTNADMLGVKIKDQMADCFELVDASIHIYEVKLDAKGDPVPGSERMIVKNRRPYEGAAELTDLTGNESGFSFSIPEAYRHSTLKITFDTVLVDDAVASEMTNRITAEGDGWKDSSGDATDNRAEDFRIEDYAQAEGMFFLRVVKYSDTTDALALKGAEFQLTRMTVEGGKDRADLENWTETASVKTRTTNARGVLSFMFLRANEMYKLVETNPPVGYDRTEKEWYVIIRPENNTVFPSEDTIPVGGRPVEILIEKDKNYINTGIKNHPNGEQNITNNLKLKKLGQNSQTLAGVKFDLYLDNKRVKTGVTGEDGVLELVDLDPLKEGRYYILRETTPEGYEKAAPIRVYVTVQKYEVGNDTYTMRLTRTDEQGNETPINLEGEDWLITNEAIRRSGSFRKVDQNGDLVTGFDVSFDVYRRGDGGSNINENSDYTVIMVPEGENADQYVRYNVQPTVTSEDGVVSLKDFYYGYYKLEEQADDGKLLSTAQPVYVLVNEKGVFALPAGEFTDEQAAVLDDSEYTVNLGNAGSLIVENNLKWGLVQVNKAVGKYEASEDGPGSETAELDKGGKPIPVSGAVFAIYRDKNGTRENAPMMHVKTDADGHFIMLDADAGKYQCFDQNGNAVKDGNKDTGKVLPVGSYYLQEVKVQDGSYHVNGGVCKFEIAAGSGEGKDYKPAEAVVISTNAQGEPVISQDSDDLFLNIPVRRGVNLRKFDKTYDKDAQKLNLNNAEFHVYDSTGKNLIAELIYDKSAAGPSDDPKEQDRKYVLKPMGTIEGCKICEDKAAAVNKDGIPYLAESKDGKSYELLTGTYIVRETKAPVLVDKDGNEYPGVYPELTGNPAKARLVVTAQDAKLESTNGSAIFRGQYGFKNQAKTGSFEVDKKVLELTGGQNTNEGQYSYGQNLAGFQFKLTALELMHGAVQVTSRDLYTRTTGEKGLVNFNNIPIGKYRLDETDVPKAYKSGNEWLVRKMPTIYVKVEADPTKTAAVVTYYSDDKFETLLDVQPSDIPTDQSNAYDKNDAAHNLAAYNSLKLADIEGSKEAVFGNQQTSLGTLEGAEFTLTHKALGYTFKYTTGADGRIIFNKVPYGEYTLSETKAPDGYEKMADMTFTVNSKTVVNDGTNGGAAKRPKYEINANRAEADQPLKNKVITVNARFKKVDQNGDAVSSDYMGAQFKVTQTETPITGLADGPFETGNALSPFANEAVFAVDEQGILNIKGLPYGTYEVQELADSVDGRLDETSELAHFILTVEKGSDGTAASGTKVTVKPYAEGNGVSGFLKNLLDANRAGWHIDGLKPGGTADFSVTDANAPLMTNVLKYGFVAIKKVRGEQTGDGTYEPSEKPVKGAVFEIYQADKNGGRGSLYLTLKTNAEGRFPAPDQDGRYQDAVSPGVKKALVAGDYILREKEIEGSSAYRSQADGQGDPEIPFTITGKDKTVWFGTDGKGQFKQTEVDTGAGSDETFMNIPKRGTLHFTKVDGDTNEALKGAVFGIYDGYDGAGNGRLVAFAEYAASGTGEESDGVYRVVTAERAEVLAAELAAANEGWSLTTEKEDASGAIPYISDLDGAGWLLEGSYTLKELRAPNGDYKLLDEAIQVNIKDGNDTPVSSSGAAEGIVKNHIQKTAAALTFKKLVEENAYRPDADVNGFTFVLRGKPANGDAAWTEQRFTSGADETVGGDPGKAENGIFRIADIPAGTYELYEQKPAEDAYQGFDGREEVKLLDIIVTADDSGIPKVEITAADTASGTEPDGILVEVTQEEGGEALVTGARITNHFKTGSIEGHKVARAGGADGTAEAPVEGIYFALYEAEDSEKPIAGAGNAGDAGAENTGSADAEKYLAVTDAEGNFRFENVPYGTYWVGEYGTADGGVPEGYVKNGMRQQVTVNEHGQEVKVPESFVNKRLRGTVVLDKVSASDKDSDGNPVKLSGAEFTVYTNQGTEGAPVPGTAVAYLTEAPGNPGHYVLNRVNGEGTALDETVPAGRIGAGLPYLEYDSATDTFWLAYGTYVVAETKTPAGYQPDVQKKAGRNLITGTPETSLLKLHPLTISGDQGQLWYVGNESASTKPQTFANTRSLAELKITKQAELPTYSGAEQKFEAGAGFRFAVSGTVEDPGAPGGSEGLDLIEYLKRTGRTDLNNLIVNDPVTGAERVELSSDASGLAALKGLPAGTYTVEELVEDSDSYRYQPSHADNGKRQVKIGFGYNAGTGEFEPSYEWTWSPDGNGAVSGSASGDVFKNHLKRGAIQGRKVAADNEMVGLEGAVFGLYTDEDCTDGSRVMTATSSNAANPSGGFVFDQVPYGTYYIKEIKAPSGYVPSTMQYRVDVTAQGAHVTQGVPGGETILRDIVFTNSNKWGSVQLTKRSEDGTGRTELMRGMAEFTIYADAACPDAEAVAYLKDSDRDGVYTLEGGQGLKQTENGVRYLQQDETGELRLIQGTYWLKETKIPDGYEAEMDGDVQKSYRFTIHSEDDKTVQDLGTVIISNSGNGSGDNSNSGNDADGVFYNRLALGGFTLEKAIETSNAADLTMADDKPGAGFVFEITGRDAVAGSGQKLADITTLRINGEAPEEADKTADGGIRVTTDKDGRVQISGLPVGSYTVTEIDGLNYSLYKETEPRRVELTQSSDKAQLLTKYDGVEADPAAEPLLFRNSLKRYTIAGQKADDGGLALAGAEFGLYDEDGTVRYRTAVSAEDGRFSFDGIPVGEYVVKEIKAPSEAYTKDDTEYRVSVRDHMDTALEIRVSESPIVNTLKRGNIEGLKLTNRKAPLAGAVIGLFAEDVTEYVEANLYEGRQAVSEADGSFVFRDVPYGTYKVAEIKAPSGYGLNRVTAYVVKITRNGETVKTGRLAAPNREPADTETELVIINNRNSGGGDGGGPNTPGGSSEPGGPGGGLPIPDPNGDMLVTINDSDVPLGRFLIPIEDEEVPLALPKTGNSGIPAALQALALLGSLAGAMFLGRRKKDEETM